MEITTHWATTNGYHYHTTHQGSRHICILSHRYVFLSSFTCFFFFFTKQFYVIYFKFYVTTSMPNLPPLACKYDMGLVYLFCFHLGQPPCHSHCHQPSNDEGRSDHNLNHSSATTSHWCVFFWPFTCFYIFTKQLYSFRLHYYTRPPPLMQT